MLRDTKALFKSFLGRGLFTRSYLFSYTYTYKEKKHDVAVWFCSFLLETAKRLEASFLVAKYRCYYIDHLRCTDQLSEALTQAHYLQVFLVDEFGEDYLDWCSKSSQ